MDGPEDSYDHIIQMIKMEEANTLGQVHSYRAALDVRLAKDLASTIGNLADTADRSARNVVEEMAYSRRALDNFRLSMDKSGQRMIYLTAALVFVGLIQALVVIVQIYLR